MKNKLHHLVILLMFIVPYVSLYSQGIPGDSLYLGQDPPGVNPEIFGQGIITLPNRDESVITFSPDGKQLFFSIDQYPNRRAMFMEYKNNRWTGPDTASFSKTRSIDEPSFSLDGSRVYYNTNNALNLTGGFDVSYSGKQDSVWSDVAISLGSPLNSTQDDYHPCIVADSSIYFAGNSGEICRSQYINGAYQNRIILPYPINYANTSQAWGDAYVSPDESYMIFQSSRSGGYGANDLYISYKKTNGSWTNPKNLGSKINTSGNDSDGDITPDGKYMTFNREWRDIYWVSSSFIDSLRHTNFVPYLKTQISPLRDTLGCTINYQVPDTTFIDDDGNNTLTYRATLSNGNPLPPWLLFDSTTRTFAGTPASTGTYRIKLFATDTAGVNVSCSFNIVVIPLPGMVDVFPLAIGNRWEYSYHWYYDDIVNPVYSYSDTGTVTIQVIDKIVTLDSTQWSIQEDKKLWEQHNGGPWLPISAIDTVGLIELHQGRHRLYRTGTIEEVRRSIFPFLANLNDTSSVFRYSSVDTAGVHSFGSLEDPPAAAYSFNFKKGVGELNVDIHDNCVCSQTFSGSHTLRNSTITGISSHQKGLQEKNYSLDQNYPNPFNPTTKISFSLPSQSFVSLKVFDVLGRVVATLVDGMKEAGIYTVTFGGSKLSSGIYIARLFVQPQNEIKPFIQTKKMVLMK